MADRNTLEGLINGKQKQLSPIDKFIQAQQIAQETEYAKALSGGLGNGRKSESSDDDAIDREVAKALKDLRLQNVMKMLKSGNDETSPNSANAARIAELERKLEESERRREQELQEQRWEARFSKLESLISNGKNKDEDSGTNRILEEMKNQREEERRERELAAKQKEKDDRIQFQLDAMEDRMAEQIRSLHTAERTGKPTDQLKEQLKDLKDTMALYDEIRGNSPQKEDRMTASDLVDTFLDKGDKVVRASRSIYDQIKGDSDLVEDTPPYEAPDEGFRPRMMSNQEPIDPELAEYLKRGKEVDDPQNPGSKVWVGIYGDAYDTDSGEGMTKEQVELFAKTQPDKFREEVLKAKDVWEQQMQKQQQGNPSPPENEDTPQVPEEAKEQRENNEDAEQQTVTENNEVNEPAGDQEDAEQEA